MVNAKMMASWRTEIETLKNLCYTRTSYMLQLCEL